MDCQSWYQIGIFDSKFAINKNNRTEPWLPTFRSWAANRSVWSEAEEIAGEGCRRVPPQAAIGYPGNPIVLPGVCWDLATGPAGPGWELPPGSANLVSQTSIGQEDRNAEERIQGLDPLLLNRKTVWPPNKWRRCLAES